jgi:hypothetical protein
VRWTSAVLRWADGCRWSPLVAAVIHCGGVTRAVDKKARRKARQDRLFFLAIAHIYTRWLQMNESASQIQRIFPSMPDTRLLCL